MQAFMKTTHYTDSTLLLSACFNVLLFAQQRHKVQLKVIY